MMELMIMNNNNNLQCLIERAKALHDEISYQIQIHDNNNNNSVSFCRFCSEHGHYCGVVTETPLMERESLIATRDSLKDVKNMLVFLQRLNSWQQKDRYEALSRLEESRLILMEKVTQFQGRSLDVMEELKTLKTYFAASDDTGTVSNWNLKRMVVEKMKQSMLCFRSLLKPWNWHREAMKLILASAFISSAFGLCRTMQDCDRSRRKIVSFADSTTPGERKDFRHTASKNTFGVFHGRG